MKAPISMLELRGGSVKGISVYERIQESKRLGYSKQKTPNGCNAAGVPSTSIGI